jgi:RES domain-containing protein
MAIWYRAHQDGNAKKVFSGDGGFYVAGRWNYKGTKVIYCSQSIALATLEWLSHNGLSVSNFDYYRFSIEIPEDLILKIPKEKLPKEWSLTPSTDKTRSFAAKKFFSIEKFLGMSVPSVLVPEESNLIINPEHPKFKSVSNSITNLGFFKAPKR